MKTRNSTFQTAEANKETIFPQKDKLHNKTIKIYKK